MALPLALGLSSAAFSVLGSISSARNATKVFRFQSKLAARNQEIALAQGERNIAQVRRRQLQERAALSQQTIEVADRARSALAASTAQAAETGTAGGSLAALIDDFERQELNAQQALARNQQFRDQQAETQVQGIQAQTQTTLLNNLPDTLQVPSFLESLGSAVNAGLSSYLAAGGKL